MVNPSERRNLPRNWIGGVALLAAALFAGALAFDLGGLQSKLFAEPIAAHAIAPTFPPPAAAITPAWYIGASGYDGAEQEQKTARANLIVYFQQRSCDGCRKFEKEVLAAPEVKSFLAGVVKVRVDPGDGEREQVLARRLGVSQLPAVAVIPQQGPPRLLPQGALSSPHALIVFSR